MSTLQIPHMSSTTVMSLGCLYQGFLEDATEVLFVENVDTGAPNYFRYTSLTCTTPPAGDFSITGDDIDVANEAPLIAMEICKLHHHD